MGQDFELLFRARVEPNARFLLAHFPLAGGTLYAAKSALFSILCIGATVGV